uniref:Uncharacterized protein n=1 Tax=viral metagenome TaxID=1070528 RepID=A0A6M3ILC3_9ZZZZ
MPDQNPTGVDTLPVPPTGSSSGVDVPPVPPTGARGSTPEPPTDESAAGLKAALLAEREKRHAAESEAERLRAGTSPPPDDDLAPDFLDWNRLDPSQGKPPAQAQPAPQDQQARYLEWFSEEMQSGDPMRTIQAMDSWYQIRKSQEDELRREARSVVPDYDTIPTYDVSPDLRMRIAQNPYLLDAVIAKARNTGSGKHRGNPPSPPPASPAPSTPTRPETELERVKREAYESGRKAERDLALGLSRGSGLSGESPSGGAPSAGEGYDLDPESISYYKKRGYSDDQIKKFAADVASQRRMRSFFGGRE